MSKKLIYAKDEKEYRRYNVFVGKKDKNSGVDLIVTNKRVITHMYKDTLLDNSNYFIEYNINDTNGTILSLFSTKISFAKILSSVFLGLVMILIGIYCIEDYEEVVGIILIVLGVVGAGFLTYLFIKNPVTLGRIHIPNSSINKPSLTYKCGEEILLKKNTITAKNVTVGSDFELMQVEIGALLEDLRNGFEHDLKPLKNKKVIKSVNSIDEIPSI